MNTMDLNMWQKTIGLGVNMYGDLDEIRLARTLGRAIEEEIKKGNKVPDEVLRAYEELYKHWQYQMAKELS
jgi:isocitrate dehydrogenase